MYPSLSRPFTLGSLVNSIPPALPQVAGVDSDELLFTGTTQQACGNTAFELVSSTESDIVDSRSQPLSFLSESGLRKPFILQIPAYHSALLLFDVILCPNGGTLISGPSNRWVPTPRQNHLPGEPYRLPASRYLTQARVTINLTL